ncbi:MAG: DUF2231 domain-containing protein [Bacteroidetes bacterium]|nr:DUF2231 domain-containing protein [Bacteroidota bacterium]
MPNIHPLIVHLPIALLTFSFLFDILGLLTRKEEFERTAWWGLLAGTIGLVLAVATGLWAESNTLISNAAREHFNLHQQFAFAATALYSFLLLWRVASRTRLPDAKRKASLILSFFGVILIWTTAWYGGELVYTFGVGVSLP